MGILDAGVGILDAGMGILDAGVGILDVGVGILDVGVDMLRSQFGYLRSQLGYLRSQFGSDVYGNGINESQFGVVLCSGEAIWWSSEVVKVMLSVAETEWRGEVTQNGTLIFHDFLSACYFMVRWFFMICYD